MEIVIFDNGITRKRAILMSFGETVELHEEFVDADNPDFWHNINTVVLGKQDVLAAATLFFHGGCPTTGAADKG